MTASDSTTKTATFPAGLEQLTSHRTFAGRASTVYVRALPHVAALGLAACLIAGVPLRWNEWVVSKGWQSTDDANTRGDVTPLSAKVGGYVRRVLVTDYQQVRAGQLLADIEDDDYRAQLAQAMANVASAQATIDNNLAQQALQQANIRAAEAGIGASRADLVRYKLESSRQRILITTNTSSRQTLEQADANEKRTAATVEQAQAQAEAQRRQLDVLRAQAKQFAAALAAQDAVLSLAKINLGYTRIVAPADGMVGERLVRPGQLVASGTQVIAVVPLPNIWVVANFKETQLAHAQPGQPAKITVDAYPGTVLHGHVETIAPASGSQFALLPPDNATGNFTKVLQRAPVNRARCGQSPAPPIAARLVRHRAHRHERGGEPAMTPPISPRPMLGVAAVLLGAIISTLYSRVTTFGLADIRGAVHAGGGRRRLDHDGSHGRANADGRALGLARRRARAASPAI